MINRIILRCKKKIYYIEILGKQAVGCDYFEVKSSKNRGTNRGLFPVHKISGKEGCVLFFEKEL